MALTPEEKQKKYEEGQLAKLNQKGFKNYSYVPGGKINDKAPLRPYNCKNLTGRTDEGYFAQTNKGKEMATKLILREMRGNIKEDRQHIKTLKGGVESLKKTLPKK